MFREGVEVPHLSGGIARHVDDAFWAEGEELIEEDLITTLARRVDDHGGFLSGILALGKERLRLTCDEGRVLDTVGLGVVPGPENAAL